MRASRLMWVALWLVGCGYKKEITALETELVASQATIEAAKSKYGVAATELSKLEARLSDLLRSKEALEKDLASRGAELDDERAKSARILADKGALRGEIESMKQALAELEERKKQAEARVQQFKDLVSRFQSLIDAGTLDVRIIDGRMVVVLATDILFASGSADLSAGGKDALTKVGQILATMPDKRFQVEGHTDNVPIATARFPNNWFLAAARAIGVTEHLVSAGMQPAQLSAASYGDTRPVAANEDKDARSANRRIEIVIVPDLSDLPGYDELTRIGQ